MSGNSTQSTVVAICTYNKAHLLAHTLASLEHQTLPAREWSVLVVDNNSTDHTAAIVDEYVARGAIPGLRRVLEKQQGLAFARRRAFYETSAASIAFIDDDCTLCPGWLEEATRTLGTEPTSGAVGGRVRIAWEVPPDDVVVRYASSFAAQDFGDREGPVPANGHLAAAGIVLRRAALEACGWPGQMTLVGRRGNTLTAGEDTEIIFRIRNAGYELWYNPAMELDHLVTHNRMTIPYLCRLHRGFGQSRPLTKSMRDNREPTLAWRVQVFAEHARRTCHLLKLLVRDHLMPRRGLTPDERIACHFKLGEIEGAWRFLLRGYKA